MKLSCFMCPYNIYTTMKRKSQIFIKENNILLQSYTKKAEKSKQHHIFSPFHRQISDYRDNIDVAFSF